MAARRSTGKVEPEDDSLRLAPSEALAAERTPSEGELDDSMVANAREVISARAKAPIPPSSPTAPSLFRLAMDHPSVILAGASSAIVVIRALSVSHYQPETALALISGGGLTGLILATLQAAVPIIGPVAVIGLLVESGWVVARPKVLILWYVLLAFAVLACWTTSIVISAFYFAGAGLYSLIHRRTGKGMPLSALTLSSFIVPGLVLALVPSQRPWFPPEVITVDSQTYTGYVIDDSAGWTRVLVDQPRYVQILPPGAIKGRVSCRLPLTWIDASPASLFFDSEAQQIPACPVR